MSKKSASKQRRDQLRARACVCVILSAAGDAYPVAASWFNRAVRYRYLIQITPLRAQVAPGYDVEPDPVQHGALQVFQLNPPTGPSVRTNSMVVDRLWIYNLDGPWVTPAERQAAIDLECACGDARAVVIRRGWA